MKKKLQTNTSPFNIAHYILLFVVVALAIAVVAWVVIRRHNAQPENNVSVPVVHVQHNDPCVQRVTNTVKRMWAYNPDAVPQKYWDMAMAWMNQPVKTTTYGLCQDVAFVCHVGQSRKDCDPCAVPSARDWVQGIHIMDMVRKNCTAL